MAQHDIIFPGGHIKTERAAAVKIDDHPIPAQEGRPAGHDTGAGSVFAAQFHQDPVGDAAGDGGDALTPSVGPGRSAERLG